MRLVQALDSVLNPAPTRAATGTTMKVAVSAARATLKEITMGASTLEILASYAERAQQATQAGGQAFARLLKHAESGDSGQQRRAALFVAATFNGRAHPFDLFELRAVDVDISDAMLTCLDALRWGRSDLYRLVPNGEQRVRAVIRQWGLGAVRD
jgi:hypothetical protein